MPAVSRAEALEKVQRLLRTCEVQEWCPRGVRLFADWNEHRNGIKVRADIGPRRRWTTIKLLHVCNADDARLVARVTDAARQLVAGLQERPNERRRASSGGADAKRAVDAAIARVYDNGAVPRCIWLHTRAVPGGAIVIFASAGAETAARKLSRDMISTAEQEPDGVLRLVCKTAGELADTLAERAELAKIADAEDGERVGFRTQAQSRETVAGNLDTPRGRQARLSLAPKRHHYRFGRVGRAVVRVRLWAFHWLRCGERSHLDCRICLERERAENRRSPWMRDLRVRARRLAATLKRADARGLEVGR